MAPTVEPEVNSWLKEGAMVLVPSAADRLSMFHALRESNEFWKVNLSSNRARGRLPPRPINVRPCPARSSCDRLTGGATSNRFPNLLLALYAGISLCSTLSKCGAPAAQAKIARKLGNRQAYGGMLRRDISYILPTLSCLCRRPAARARYSLETRCPALLCA